MATLMTHVGVNKLLALADDGLLLDDDVLTFDDGCLVVHDNLTHLGKLPQRKIAFIVPEYVDINHPCQHTPGVYYQDDRVFNNSKPFMDVHMLKDLVANGFELGMHSFAHRTVLTHGTTPANRLWRLATFFGTNQKRLAIAATMFGTDSALAVPGLTFDEFSHTPCQRTQQEFVDFVHDDTQRCAAWFERVFNYIPTTYAAPFNHWSTELVHTLHGLGVRELFGDERLNVDHDYAEIVNARSK